MSLQALALAFLAFTAIGGIAWVFLYPLLSGEKKAELRRASIARPEPVAARQADKSQRSRREQVEGSLKDLELRRLKEKSVPLSTRITQAGLSWSTQKFWIISGILAAVAGFIAFTAGGGILGAVGMGFGAGLGLPRWLLGYLKNNREKAFLKALPDAVDVIVRGIKAGLPLFELIKVVAADAPEPLKSEFLAIIETQTIGMPLGEACSRLYERMPVAGSELLRHRDRDPAEIGRQFVGSARQPFEGAARPQEDGRKRFRRCRWKPRPPPPSSARCRSS